MILGFDLDGTLDREAVRELALCLISAGHQVHIISGSFPEAGAWQRTLAKYEKLQQLGFDVRVSGGGIATGPNLWLHVVEAVDHEKFDRDYRLVDIGLRKGDLIRQLRIQIMFDDSELFIKTMPSMCGAQMVHVR